jgi:TIR domain
MAEGAIFVCYRGEDSIAHAGRLYDSLAAHFGKNRVFMDIDTVEPGEDFVQVIEQKIDACQALIAIIGNSWVDAAGDDGVRRLDNSGDFVRLEITAALKRNVRVIPALVGGAAMPRSLDLPEPMKALARRNAIEISDTAFHQSVARLIETLEPNALGAPAPDEQIRAAGSLHRQRATWWWQFHQCAAALAYCLMAIPAWYAHELIPGAAGRMLFFTTLGALILATILRLHLVFASKVSPGEVTSLFRRTRPWIMVADALFTLSLIWSGVMVGDARMSLAVLLVSVGIGSAVVAMFIEPTTARAALTNSSS